MKRAGLLQLFACLPLSGCWLIGDMGELTNEGPQGGAAVGAGGAGGDGAGGGGGGGGGAGAGGVGGAGAGGSGGGSAVCEPVSAVDDDFEVLAICHDLTQARVSADNVGLTIVGQVGGSGFVQTFDAAVQPLAHATLASARSLRIEAVGSAQNRTSFVVGTIDEGVALSVLEQTEPVCEGESCGFIAAFDTDLTGAVVARFDAGAGGSVELDDVDVGQVGEYDDDRFLAVGGALRGAATFFDQPLSAPDERAFLVTANIQTGAPESAAGFVVPTPSRELSLAINPRSAPAFRVFTTYTEDDQATFNVLDPDEQTFIVGGTANHAGTVKSMTRTPTGAAYAVVAAGSLTTHRVGNVVGTAGPFEGITGGRVRADNANGLWIASSYEGSIDLGGPLESAGGRDPLLIYIPVSTTDGQALTLPAPSTDDDQFTDLAAVNTAMQTTLYATLTFKGTLELGGQSFTATPGGSMLLLRVAN